MVKVVSRDRGECWDVYSYWIAERDEGFAIRAIVRPNLSQILFEDLALYATREEAMKAFLAIQEGAGTLFSYSAKRVVFLP